MCHYLAKEFTQITRLSNVSRELFRIYSEQFIEMIQYDLQIYLCV